MLTLKYLLDYVTVLDQQGNSILLVRVNREEFCVRTSQTHMP